MTAEGGPGRRVADSLPSFENFYAGYHCLISRYLRRSLPADDVDDCVQDVFLAAFRAYRALPVSANLQPWIMTIARHKAIDMHRARARRPILLEEIPELPAPETPREETGFWVMVGELPRKQKVALLHRFVSDLPYREIGPLIGSSPESARQNVHEALKKLRAPYAGRSFGGSRELIAPHQSTRPISSEGHPKG